MAYRQARIAVGVMALVWAAGAGAGQYGAMVGQWQWQDFTVKVTESGKHGLSAEVVDGPRNVGMEMIRSELEKKGDAVFVGRIKHPSNGKVYNTKLSRQGEDAWELDGCTDSGACATGVFERAE